VESLAVEVGLEHVCRQLSLDEDERQALELGQQRHELHALVLLRNPLNRLRDEVGRGANAAHRDENVVVQEVLRKTLEKREITRAEKRQNREKE